MDCVRVILSYQNWDGGMATYENTRSFHALEVSLAKLRVIWQFRAKKPVTTNWRATSSSNLGFTLSS